MNEDALVETMARSHLMQRLSTGKTPLEEVAAAALAALRAEGFEVYRREECERVATIGTDDDGENAYVRHYYRVPVGEGTDDE